MIQVYSPGNEDFTKNGDCTLLPISAGVHAILGGAWEATLIHPLDDEGRWRYLVEEAVVKMPSFNGDQLFRIRKPEKSDMGVECRMEPIFYDARNVFLTDVRPTNKNGQDALDYICAGATKFSGSSDIAFRGSAEYQYKNLLEAIAGDDDNSFVNRWGGEPIYDNYTVTINARAGGDYNVEIRYGKNLPENGMDVETDMSSVATRIYPKAYNRHEMSNHGYVNSPLINSYAQVYPKTITYDTVKMKDDATDADLEDAAITICETQAQLNTALRAKCEAEFAAGIDKPKISISCDMILLQNTEQYADIADLEDVALGDTVHCYNNHLDITTSARVMELTYDSINKRIDNVTLGAYRKTFLDIFNHKVKGIDDLAARANSALNADGTIMAERIRGFLNGAVASLRAQYNVAERQNYIAILFENLDTTSDLYGALALGTQGLMISKRRNSAGTDWVWTTAATSEGVIANTIVTGTISDASGANYWDLDNHKFVMSEGSIDIGNGTFKVTSQGHLTCQGADCYGEFFAGNTSGYWIKLVDDGQMVGGNGSNRYGRVDFTATDYDSDVGRDRHGVRIVGDVLRIDATKISINNSTNTSNNGTFGYSGTVMMPTSINSDGTVATWTPGFAFINGFAVG